MCRLFDLCSVNVDSITDNPYFVHGAIGLAFILVFFILFMLTATVLAAFSRRKEIKAISSSFKSLLKEGDYSIPPVSNPLQAKIASLANPSAINQIIKNLEESREAYLGDVLFKIKRGITPETGENIALADPKKDTYVEQYTTWLLIPHNFSVKGEIRIKPRREITGLVSDIPELLGDSFPGAMPDFEKSYIVKFDNVTEEQARQTLNAEVQKTLVTRKKTYPVNTDVKWITFTEDALIVECCRIMEAEDLRRLVTFGRHIIERPQQEEVKPKTRKRTVKISPEIEPPAAPQEKVEPAVQKAPQTLQKETVEQVEVKTETASEEKPEIITEKQFETEKTSVKSEKEASAKSTRSTKEKPENKGRRKKKK
jgi:hypothetical protein